MVLKVQEDVVRIVHRPPLATTGCLNYPRFALEGNRLACLQAVAADSHSCASQICYVPTEYILRAIHPLAICLCGLNFLRNLQCRDEK